MVTISHIAEKAGVSPATVSQILNGKYKENRPSMRERAGRIRSIAAELGYKPNAAAKTMTSGRFDAISLLMDYDGWGHDLPRDLMGEIMSALNARGMQLSLTHVTRDARENPEQLPTQFKQACIDGALVWFTLGAPSAVVDLCQTHKLPSVYLNTKLPKDCVYPDDHGAGYAMTQRFQQQGYKRIMYLGHNVPQAFRHYSVDDRHEGYLDAMRDGGMTPCAAFAPINAPFESTVAFLRQQVKMHEPDAVICYGGLEQPLMTSSFSRSLPVGYFTQDPRLLYAGPHIAMRIPNKAMGAIGVDCLLKKIATGRSFKSKAIPFEELHHEA